MKKTLQLLCALSLLPMSPNLFAGDLGINVILASASFGDCVLLHRTISAD